MPDDDDFDDEQDVRHIWHALRVASDPDDREDLLIRLAELALMHHDFSDQNAEEDVHGHFEHLRQAQRSYHVIALRVGRFIARSLESDEAHRQAPSDEAN